MTGILPMDSSLCSEWRAAQNDATMSSRVGIVARDLIALQEDFSQVMALEMTVDGFFTLLRMTDCV